MQIVPFQRSRCAPDAMANSHCVSTTPSRSTPDPRRVQVRILTGPDVAAPQVLASPMTLIGRGRRCGLRIDDAGLEPHHLRVVIDDDGGIEVMQLAGRVPMRVGDRPLRCWSGTVIAPEVIEIASTRLVIEAVPLGLGDATVRLVASGPLTWSVLRPPRRPTPDPVAPAEADLWSSHGPGPHDDDPSAPASGGIGGAAMIGSAMTLVAASVMAVVTGQVLFMVFALTAVVGTSVTWGWGWWQRRRQRRGERRRAEMVAVATERARAAASAAHRAAHLARYRPVGEALSDHRSDRLWARRSSHGDAFTTVFGESAEEIEIVAGPGAARSEAIPPALTVGVDLGASRAQVIAVTGPHATAVITSMVVQLAIQAGPADWGLVRVVDALPGEVSGELSGEASGETRGDGGHRWERSLPHWLGALGETAPPDQVQGIVDAAQRGRRIVLLISADAVLRTRDAPIRRLIDELAGRAGGGGCDDGGERSGGVTVLVDIADASWVPSICTGVLHTGLGVLGRWNEAERTERVRLCGVTEQTAASIAAELSMLVDPEQSTSVVEYLPDEVGLDDLDGVPTDLDGVIAAWTTNREPSAPIGIAVDAVGSTKTLWLNLASDGPHGLIAGTTGSGKSELLRTLVIALAARLGPDQLNFVLVDYKGGATFDACAGLPHTVGLVTDLDEGLAARALVSLNAELHRREVLLRSAGAVDIDDPVLCDPTGTTPPLPRLLVVIDEFAALVTEVPGFIGSLVGIAQRGRSLGVHLLLATQRPAGVIDDAIRANTDLRLALRLNDRSDAIDVVGTAEPAGFSRTAPGRALVRLGADTETVFQAATSRHPHRSGRGTCLEHLAQTIAEAAARCGGAAPHRPWLAALDSLVSEQIGGMLEELCDGDAIGIVDDPRHQRYLPLIPDTAVNLAIVGALGSGTSTALTAVVAHGLSSHEHVAVIAADRSVFGGGDGVIALGETERIGRVVARWTAEIDRRRTAAATETTSPWLLAIDGLVALRRRLEALPTSGPRDLWESLDRVLAEGPAVGLRSVVVIEDEGSRVAGLVSRFSERWVMRIGDSGDAAVYGVRADTVPGPDAPPGSMVVFSSGLAGRVVVDESSLARLDALEGVGVLPADLAADEIVVSSTPGSLVIGRRFDDLGHASVDIAVSTNAMVLGPARSGRTTTLATLGLAWATAARSAGRGTAIAVVGTDASAALRSGLADTAVRVHGLDPDRYRPADRAQLLASALQDWLDTVDGSTMSLVLIDDADRLDDPDGALARLVDGRNTASFIAAARPDVLRQSYGHWTTALRRDRCGLVLAAAADHDADLLGEPVARRLPIPARPGLGWWIGSGPAALIQIANACSTADSTADAVAVGSEPSAVPESVLT